MKKRNALIAVLLVTIGVIVGVTLTARMGIEELSLAEKTGVSKESADFLGKLNSALSEVVAAVKPSVVNVSTTKTVSIDQTPFGHFFDDPALRRFFGDMFDFHGPREFRSSSLGSGVIVSEDGYIHTYKQPCGQGCRQDRGHTFQ